MRGMKYKKGGFSSTHEDHWKSFTDIFATVCLMFFFVLVIFGILSSYVGNRAKKLEEDLEIEKAALAEYWSQIVDLEEKNRLLDEQRAKFEKDAQSRELQIAELLEQLLILQSHSIEITSKIANDLLEISLYKDSMYEKIESMLKEALGENVHYDRDKGTISIGSDIFFEKNSYTLLPEHKAMVAQIRNVLFDIIDEYVDPANESLVHFKYFDIVGHADLSMSGSYNRLLSSRRAISIVDEILPDGSTEEDKYGKYFKSSGLSKFDPKEGTVYEQTPSQMDANRRVEIIIVLDESDILKAVSEIADALKQTTSQYESIDISLDEGEETEGEEQ